MTRFVIPAALMFLGGCAATPQQIESERASAAKTEAELAEALTGYTAGRPQYCIPIRQQQSTIYGNKILYRTTGRQVFVTDTNGGCFGMSRNDVLVTRSFTGQLCRGDIVTTVDPISRIQTGACSFGDFVPYTKDRRPRG